MRAPLVRIRPTGNIVAQPEPGTYYRVNGGPKLCIAVTAHVAVFAGAVGTPNVRIPVENLRAYPLPELALERVDYALS